MVLTNKKVLVYGTGLSGRSAVSFLLKKGASVFVYDDNNSEQLDKATVLLDVGECQKLGIELCVVSPGVQILGNKNIEVLHEQGVRILSEFAFGSKFVKGKLICVTGTNGKTTTVNIIKQLFNAISKNVFLCGNTDTPITSICEQTNDKSIVICEVSSFALETTDYIKPYVATILNITDDHLLRHLTMENYIEQKTKITKWQNENDYFICAPFNNYFSNATKINYSISDKTNGAYIENKFICYANKKIMEIDKIKLKGEFNLLNILCAVSIAKIFKIKNRVIKKVIENFAPLKHRIEFIRMLHGVQYINDSKSTNPDSTVKALSAFNQPIVLLLGGFKKGLNFWSIFEHCENVKQIVAFGECRNQIKKQATESGYNDVIVAKQMCDAVSIASTIALNGDVVLLSPACSSFDEFSSYKHRGEVYRQYVEELK